MSERNLCPRTGESCKTASYCDPANRPLVGIIPYILAAVPGTSRDSAVTQLNRAIVEEGDALHIDISPCVDYDSIRVCPVEAVFGPLGQEHGEEFVAGKLEIVIRDAVEESTSRLSHMSDMREINRANRA